MVRLAGAGAYCVATRTACYTRINNIDSYKTTTARLERPYLVRNQIGLLLLHLLLVYRFRLVSYILNQHIRTCKNTKTPRNLENIKQKLKHDHSSAVG